MFIKSSNQIFVTAVCVFSLVSCNSGTIAPVVELHPQYSMNKSQSTYVVRPGDTLYAIAFLYDQNYEQLAQANQIIYPYHLKSGQIIRLTPKGCQTKVYKPLISRAPHVSYRHQISRSVWQWPTQGYIAKPDSNRPIEQKGIGILGQPRQPILAAADGVVAYAGDGLPGYGHLILIKHGNDFLSAYAFNASNLVHEGERVYAGQKIATMGRLQTGKWGLHFEIRYRGSVLNPLKFLPSH